MRNKLYSIFIVLSMLLSNMAVAYADTEFEGEGTSENPYLINTADDLVKLAGFTNNSNDKTMAAEYAGKYYQLTADIDMSGYDYRPISYASNMSSAAGSAFTGTLDGNGHVIKNISFANIAQYGATYGIIGYLGANAVIKNLGVEDMIVNGGGSGRLCIGGIAGTLNAGITIEGCYVRGMKVTTTSSDSTYTGGITGRTVGNGGIIKNCYTADLSFTLGNANYSGGIIGGCGNVAYKAENCYTLYSKLQGWAAATNSYITNVNSYYSTAATEVSAETLGEGFKENPTLKNDGYPLLEWESTDGYEPKEDEEEEEEEVEDPYFTGKGTEEEPFEISSAENLTTLAQLTNSGETAEYASKYYKLTEDIDMSGIAYKPVSYASNMSSPQGKAFSGTFDGNNHVIRNISFANIAQYGATYGIIGFLGTNGVVKNLGVENMAVSGVTASRLCIGGIVGSIGAGVTIENCYVRQMAIEVQPSGSDKTTYVGGIAGRTLGASGIIRNAYATGLDFSSITNQNNTAGILGSCGNTGYQAENCYTTHDKTQGNTSATNSYMVTTNCYSGSKAVLIAPSELGEAFEEDADLLNNGMPILAWEYDIAHPQTVYYTIKSGETEITDGATDISAENPFVITFDKEMNADTFNRIKVFKGETELSDCIFTVEAEDILAIKINAEYNTEYTIFISKKVQSVIDEDGKSAKADEKKITFRTEAMPKAVKVQSIKINGQTDAPSLNLGDEVKVEAVVKKFGESSSQTAALIVALFGQDGVMKYVALDTAELGSESETLTVEFTVPENAGANPKIEIMVWDSITTMNAMR